MGPDPSGIGTVQRAWRDCLPRCEAGIYTLWGQITLVRATDSVTGDYYENFLFARFLAIIMKVRTTIGTEINTSRSLVGSTLRVPLGKDDAVC